MFRLYVTGDLGFEFWMDIPGYEGLYQASTYGRVRSYPRKCTKGIILKAGKASNGYYTVSLGGVKTVPVHRLVCDTFLPNPENKPCIDHKDTNRLNNRIENLQYVTYAENNSNPTTTQKLSLYHDRLKKTVYAYTKDGVLLGTYKSMKEASRVFGTQSSKISRCARGLMKTTAGVVFRTEPI